MNNKRRLISVFIIVCMLISSATISASAASTGKIKVRATQNNSDAQEVLKLINKQRSKRGKAKLKLDKKLCKAASRRAAELMIYVPESSPHKRPNGKKTRSINGKIIYECCAEGYETPKAVVHGWMTSPPHKKGILLSNARSVGIGCVTSKNGYKYWTLEFSSSKAKSVMKSRKKVTSTYKITALSKYLKKKNFSIGFADDEYGTGREIEVGDTIGVVPYYTNNFGMSTPLKVSDYKWKSGNNSIASIDSKGKVTALKTGTAVIYATMKKSPKYKLKLKLKVTDHMDYVDTDDDDFYTYDE